MPNKFDKVLIDYGHGGFIDGEYQTRGKRYTFVGEEPSWTIYEGEVNRRIAARLISMLLNYNVETYDVVAQHRVTEHPSFDGKSLEQGDTYLTQRVKYANRQKDSILISIHANAIGNRSTGASQSARGFAAFTSVGQTEADLVADSIADEMDRRRVLKVRRDTSDGDADYERDFYMLHKTAMPAVLTENGFFTNIDDAKILMNEYKIIAIAKAHFEGLLKHLNVKDDSDPRGCSFGP